MLSSMESLCLATVFLFVPAPEPKPQKDEKLLQGTWNVMTLERNGRKYDYSARNPFQMILNGDKWTWGRPGSGTVFVFSIDPKSKTKSFRLRNPNGDEMGLVGIYALEGDTLTLCYKTGNPALATPPLEFKSTDVQTVLMILKRQKP